LEALTGLFDNTLCLDVRSPGEYEHAHIPGAKLLALFTDEERAAVGTLYKRCGKREAIRRGVEIVGPKLPQLLSFFEQECKNKPQEASVLIYCWRGGMRSGFLHAFLSSLGFSVEVLAGGYKAFRKKALSVLLQPRELALLGGFTGCGKTELLKQIKQVLDLEELASHRGSAFGDIPGKKQPSCEHFENLLAVSLSKTKGDELLWVEDESRLIGKCCVPNALFEAMRTAPLYVIERPLEERIERVHALYAPLSKAFWIEATHKVAKRLGGAMAKEVLQAVEKGALKDAIGLLFCYYDKAYAASLKKHRGPVHFLDTVHDSAEQIIRKLQAISP
jgi:tRNA 2-selenouridine synthase